MTIAYIILVLVVCYLVSRKKKSSAETAKEKPEFIVALLTALGKVAVGFAVVYFGFAIFFFDTLIEDYWLFFDEKRTVEIENRYGIIVDDDVKLKKYKVVAHREGAMRTLEFQSDIDGSHFMQKNCQGELIQYAENNMFYDLESPDTEPYSFFLDDGQSGIYWYEYQNHEYGMNFYCDGDKYRVEILY